jgi:preprotein translocase subunit SecE
MEEGRNVCGAGAGVGSRDMSKLRDFIQGIKVFCDDVVMKTRKSSWPNRDELISSTMVVIISALIISAFVGISDFVLHRLLRILLS